MSIWQSSECQKNGWHRWKQANDYNWYDWDYDHWNESSDSHWRWRGNDEDTDAATIESTIRCDPRHGESLTINYLAALWL